MRSMTTSSYEKKKRDRRRGVGRRSRTVDGSSCNSSEDERNESRSRDRRRNGGKEYVRFFHRERRSGSSQDRSRRRKRSPSPSRPTRKKIRSSSDIDNPHSRSRSIHYHSHSQCKYSSFHKRHWHRSGGSIHDCCCVSFYYSERENINCSKRKDRSSRSPLRSGEGKHHRSPSRESVSHGSNSKSLETSTVRRQTSCDVNYFPENTYLPTESDCPGKGSYPVNGAQDGKVLTLEEFRCDHGSKRHSAEKGRHSPPPLQLADPGVSAEKLRLAGAFTDELLDGLGDWSASSVPRKCSEDQLVKPGTLETVVRDSSEWLDLSLKAPAKPTPKIEGVSREDLRLCLDSSMPPAPTVSEALADDKSGANVGKKNNEKAPPISSRKEDSEASFCSTSFSSVHAGGLIFNGSVSGASNLPDIACPGNTTRQGEATSGLNNATTPPSSDRGGDQETSGSPHLRGHETKEHRCFYLMNQLISMREDKDEKIADCVTDPQFSGIWKQQPADLAISGKEEPQIPNAVISHRNADMSVSVIEISNSISAEQKGVGRAELSGENKEVNSVDCFMLAKEKTEVSAEQYIAVNPGGPPKLCLKPSIPLKTSPLKAPPCLVVELSDSTTMKEDDDEQVGEIESQPRLPSTNVSQLNETSDKSKPLPTLNVPPLRSSCPQDSSIARTSLPVRADAAVERTRKDAVQNFSDLDRATDLFIKKVHSLLHHARPHSAPLAARPSLRSSLTETLSEQPGSNSRSRRENPSSCRPGSVETETLSEQPGSKSRSRRENPSSCRPGSVEIVQLSDSSLASSSSDESDSGIELAFSTKRCNHERKFKPVEPREKTQQPAEVLSDHPLQCLNEDVVCCSLKPPLKRVGDAYGTDQQSRVTFMRDKHGNLIQVVDVDDSDIEDESEEPDTKSFEEDKEDGFFSSHPLVLPAIKEIKEILQCETSNVEKSSEVDDQSKLSSPTVVKPSARTQISSPPPSQRNKSCKLVLEAIESQQSDHGTEADVGTTAVTSTVGLKQSEKWKKGIVCDLCSLGTSLALGEWYCWCCGIAATKCQCPEEKKLRKQLSLGYRKGQKLKKKGTKYLRYLWSGKVHKMCALWSSEVYVKQSPKKEPYYAQLEAAVKRGNTLVCKHPDCKKTGATLGCRVRACRRSYHYPCAENLANQCMVRMWDGVLIPIACQYHRHVEEQAERSRERLLRSKITDPVRDGKTAVPAERPYIGKNLLCQDIAQGQEQVQIPCTNDVDDELAPNIRYITKCWFKGRPVDHLHPVGTELAKGCQGCAGSNFDSLHTPMPPHVMGASKSNRSRESDDRLDWQGERMYGRLPYNSAGLLQLGPDSKDVVECNSRCKCGPKCKNRELQKGLRCHLELFKTKDRGWGVRALEQIPRGKFVVEYVGDVLTPAEADERGEKYDQNQLSYLFNLDHPGVPHSAGIVLDGITMSNIARFINHSCEGNLMIFRVFSETTDLRYFRIGMYAIQDIEVGDELSYDYNYASSKDSSEMVDDPTAIRCFCGTQTCRKWLWQGGDSGLKH